MAKVEREILVKRVFNDVKNYPYGFSHSGDFSISEARELAQHGALFAALMDGDIQPQTEEDEHFLAAAHGKAEPQNVAEKAWIKYQARINRPKTGSIYGSKRVSLDEELETSDESDMEIELDD